MFDREAKVFKLRDKIQSHRVENWSTCVEQRNELAASSFQEKRKEKKEKNSSITCASREVVQDCT